MNIKESDSLVIYWLYLIGFMVFLMVFIGGITRLTDSGLSIVDWRPIMGTIPPLNHEQWILAFKKYQAYPEFKLLKSSMDLAGFKSIYFWEYFHRVFGRLIGIVFLFPFIYFKMKGKIPQKQNAKLLFLFCLGALQGLMGWYMVKSGLVSQPDVSHYRLAAHLSLAFIIIGYVLWIILNIKYPNHKRSLESQLKWPLVLFFTLLCIQIVYGAFVAGLDAGLTHNTFPKMGKNWLPIMYKPFSYSWLFEDKVIVQFIHRCVAWLLLLSGAFLYSKLRLSRGFLETRSIQLALLLLVGQFALGVMTLLTLVPISLASLHQIGACALLLLSVRSLFFTFSKKDSEVLVDLCEE